MYYCNNCNQFITPIFNEETYTDKCPECGSEGIKPANECGICKAPIKSNEDYCQECLKLAKRYAQGIKKYPEQEEKYILELAIQLHTTTNKARDLILAEMEIENGKSSNS